MSVLTCLSLPSHRLPMAVLERLACPGDAMPEALSALRGLPGVAQVMLLSTCERTEIYALCADDADPFELVRVLAAQREVPAGPLVAQASCLTGPAAARHLFRVASGLESFVIGETDIVAQVRTAATAALQHRTLDLELDRLVGAAINTSRRVHRATAFGDGAGSVAGAAVHAVDALLPAGVAGREVLVVGAGPVAASALATARALGAAVTLCNRSAANAARIALPGTRVRGLHELAGALAGADVVVFGTSAAHRLLDAAAVRAARDTADHGLVVVDLCVPRNVDPDVRDVPGVRLLDLTDLRNTAQPVSRTSADVQQAEAIVEEGVDRFARWLGGRAGAASVRRLRADVEACAQLEIDRAVRGLPAEVQPLVAEGIRRAVHHLAHEPTRRLLDAAAAGDDQLVGVLAGLFAPQR